MDMHIDSLKTVKMSILPIWIYGFNINPIKILKSFFLECEKFK